MFSYGLLLHAIFGFLVLFKLLLDMETTQSSEQRSKYWPLKAVLGVLFAPYYVMLNFILSEF